VATSGGIRTPRPLGESIHAERPNQVLHFDFLYMGVSNMGAKYVLILKDDFSGFCMLHVCKDADSETTVTALMKWSSLFGVVPMWVFNHSFMPSTTLRRHTALGQMVLLKMSVARFYGHAEPCYQNFA
jgi:hypothetical protein